MVVRLPRNNIGLTNAAITAQAIIDPYLGVLLFKSLATDTSACMAQAEGSRGARGGGVAAHAARAARRDIR